MTAGVRGRRRSQGTGKLVVLSARAAVALLQPLVDGLQQSISDIQTPLATTPP